MKIGAVIAEYNPFHNGHTYQLADFRKSCGLDFCIVIMSGNFVQRGEPSICDKRKRAEWALKGGADLVMELPVYYSMSNAMAFSRGAVGILKGVADILGFGAETDDLELLQRAASIDTSTMHSTLGKAFPRYVAETVRAEYGEELYEVFSNPNNTLAVEYIRAIKELCPEMSIYVTKRMGTAHDSTETHGGYASASFLRQRILNDESISDFVPSFVHVNKTVKLSDMGQLIMYSLRNMKADELKNTADVAEGLENLILREVMKCVSYEELLGAIKSKRYTMARLKRICMSALLGISNEHIYAKPEYIHVLGVRECARKILLPELEKRSKLKVLVKGSDYNKCTNISFELLKIDLKATDTYSLFYNELPNSDVSNKLLVF